MMETNKSSRDPGPFNNPAVIKTFQIHQRRKVRLFGMRAAETGKILQFQNFRLSICVEILKVLYRHTERERENFPNELRKIAQLYSFFWKKK